MQELVQEAVQNRFLVIMTVVTDRVLSTCNTFESLILSHHSRYKVTCECHEEDINDDDGQHLVQHLLQELVQEAGSGGGSGGCFRRCFRTFTF